MNNSNLQIIIASKNYTIHQQLKTILEPHHQGLIHTTDLNMGLQIVSQSDETAIIFDLSDELEMFRVLRRNKSKKTHFILISNKIGVHHIKEFNNVYLVTDSDEFHLIPKILITIQEKRNTAAHNGHSEVIHLNDVSMHMGCKETPLIGNSENLKYVWRTIQEVANSNMSILIRGESGTGKDVVSRLIHAHSHRAQKGKFQKINCPSIPESLFESELFGHEGGAFTGATNQKLGRIELADKGTLFLDEIGEIPPHIQCKLLEFIEHKQFMRVGGSRTLTLDVRIISATNASLETMIDKREFRADLFYRLNEYVIYLPPLRERVKDLPLLVDYFCQFFAEENNVSKPEMPAELLQRMMQYHWPGNVRERNP